MRRLLLLFALTALIAACSNGSDAASPTTTTTTSTTTPVVSQPPPPIVAALGDSLLYSALGDLEAELGGGLDLRSHAVIGLRADDARFGLEGLLQSSPQALVVVLGTNHALDGFSEHDGPAIDRLAGLMLDVPCVRWFDVTTSSHDEKLNEAARAVNAELTEAVASMPNGTLVPWSATVAGHPEWLTIDGVHLTDDGAKALAERLAFELRGCLGQLALDQ